VLFKGMYYSAQPFYFLPLILLWLCGVGAFFAMPPHPRVKNPVPGSERTQLGSGGIRSSFSASVTHRSLQAVSSRINNILVLRTNFTGSTAEFDTFSLGSADNAYSGVASEVERYYRDQSRGKHLVDLTFVPMVSGIAFPNPHTFYGDASTTQLQIEAGVRSVLAQWDPHIDFADYDSVMIMHAGTGQEVRDGAPTLVNSFRSSLTDPYQSADGVSVFSFVMVPEHFFDRIESIVGVIVHEYGHELGLPDLYDTSFQSQGIGDWGVMAGGSFGGPGNNGTVPTGFCGWSRVFLGWEEPELVSSSTHTLLHHALGGRILKIFAESSSKASEYFLIENRFNKTLSNSAFNWDQYLPLDGSGDSTGILITHVDEGIAFLDYSLDPDTNRWDGNELQINSSHKFLDVEETSLSQGLDVAEGSSDSADTWHSGSSVSFGANLAEPYSENPNNLSITFSSSPGESMNLTISQNFQVLARDASLPGILRLEFSSDVMNSLATNLFSFTPSLGTLSANRQSSAVIELSYSATPNRTVEYSLSFGAIGSGGETPASVSNVLGTSPSAYLIEGLETWNEAGSPYVITQDLFIESASRLILESGTVVLIDSGFSGSFPSTKVDLTVKGQLMSLGTKSNPVRILPRDPNSLPNWGTIFLSTPRDKPSVFIHTTVRGGGIGGNGCLGIRDDAEHILAYMTLEFCDFGVRVGENYSTQTTGTIREGGGRPRIYQSVFEDVARGILLDSSNPGGLYLNNVFRRFSAVGVNYQALSAGSMENFRFYMFEGGKFSDGAFEFANTSGSSGPVFELSDLHEFSLERVPDTTNCTFQGAENPCSSPCDRCSLMQLDPNAGSIGERNSTLSEKISTDFNISLIEFKDPADSQTLSRLVTGSSFQVRITADSLTNFNATTRRLLAIKLETGVSEHPILIPLQEETNGGKTFLSDAISTSLTGVSSSTHLVLASSDTIRAVDLSSGLSSILPVGSFGQVPAAVSPISTFKIDFSENLSVVQIRFTTQNAAAVSSASLEFSTDGNQTFMNSSAFQGLSTAVETTHTLNWLPFYDLPPGYSGEVSLRLGLLSADSNSHSETLTFSYQSSFIQTQISYSLLPGWNLISVYPASSATAGEFFSALNSAMSSCAYTYQVDGFYHYCPDSISPPAGSTSVELSGVLSYGSGFWVGLNGAVEVGLDSVYQPDFAYPLKKGWNLLSLGVSGSTTPQNLPTKAKLLVDFLPSGYRSLLVGSSNIHNVITSQISTFELTRAAWVYSSSDSQIVNRVLPLILEDP